MASPFSTWFNRSFGVNVPATFAELLDKHPKGMRNGYGPTLWAAAAIQAETEDRDLIEKGVCIIGVSDSIGHILLRARDGKVFIVDSHDHTAVDAWFSDVYSLVNLLNLE
jgi:hypothetical protein